MYQLIYIKKIHSAHRASKTKNLGERVLLPPWLLNLEHFPVGPAIRKYLTGIHVHFYAV